jgi:hypothetical protein
MVTWPWLTVSACGGGRPEYRQELGAPSHNRSFLSGQRHHVHSFSNPDFLQTDLRLE